MGDVVEIGVGEDNTNAQSLEVALKGITPTGISAACQAIQKDQESNPYLEAIAEQEHPTSHHHAPENYYELLAAMEQGEVSY